MSRELKFRAWDKTRCKFYTSPLWVEFQVDLNGNLSAKNLKPQGGYQNLEINQYTGLKDKNGVEIYEGDIVSGHIFGKCEVRYYKNSFVIWSIYGDYSRGYVGDNLEVIGNIYENHELLDGV